jgi:hypothetical protein
MSLWVNRKFEFVLPVDLFPNIVERLRGTPARLEEKTARLSREVLIRKQGDKSVILEMSRSYGTAGSTTTGTA